MLDYEWGNPNNMIGGGSEPEQNGRDFSNGYDHFSFNNVNDHNSNNSLISPAAVPAGFSLHHQFMPPPPQQQIHGMNLVNCVFDQRAYGGAYGYAPPQMEAPGFLVVPKAEEGGGFGGGSRIGLNLGGRTYFSSSEDDFVSRLYRRSKPAAEAGSAANAPRCQAEGCAADLTHAKHYHRRHKVCEFHSKASTVVAAGLTQRFCQQCSRFHLLSEFDNGKRSCRKRLADHNRRRRKSAQSTNENQKSQLGIARNLSSDNLASSPPDSGAHSSSSVTVAISPPRMSLDCFPPARQYGGAAPPSSSSSLFFSSG